MTTQPLLFADALQRIGCALEPDAQEARHESLQALFTHAEERQDLADGVRYRFPGNDAMLAALFGMIAAERTCCSSLRLTLQAEPQSGPLWLAITGPAEAVAALQHVFRNDNSDAAVEQLTQGYPRPRSWVRHLPERRREIPDPCWPDELQEL